MRDARSVPSAVQPFTRMDAMGSFEVPSQMELRLYQALLIVGGQPKMEFGENSIRAY